MKKWKKALCLFACFLTAFVMTACSSAPAQNTDSTPATQENAKSIVVYFSGTGNTKAVAEQIADLTGSALFEITPEKPYTEEDLNFNEESSRVVQEYENPDERTMSLQQAVPDNWDQYDTVYLGYPIWWGIPAWPMDAFVKGADFQGKTVYPFCTSLSSGLGNSVEQLKGEANGGDWKDGMRFEEHPNEEAIRQWLDSLS